MLYFPDELLSQALPLVLVVGDGFFKLALAGVRQAEAVMRFGVSAAPIGDGAAISWCRLRAQPMPRERFTQRIPRRANLSPWPSPSAAGPTATRRSLPRRKLLPPPGASLDRSEQRVKLA